MLLEAFSTTYNSTLQESDLDERIQKVKDALFRRSYEEAFGTLDNLRVYVVRWSPSRALAYSHIFTTYESINKALVPNANVLCIGGGAGAEIAALSSFQNLNVTTVDRADWEPVIRPLTDTLGVKVEMICGTALDLPFDAAKFDVITSLFTTNELFSESRAGTVKMIQQLSQNCKPGCLFVVVESAGSYSHININGKQFPMHFLLDHTFRTQGWDTVDETNSEWFRLPADLETAYPYKLENMRYLLRVYRHK